jgi:tRNA(His) 5'-end guanylyltransferase
MKHDKDSLGNRIKKYEDVFRTKLPIRMPVIIRCDGKAFSSLTRSCIRPYDKDVVECMEAAAMKLCREVSSVALAYVQSDEISILMLPYADLNTQPYFDGNIQKIVSVTASMASTAFMMKSLEIKNAIDKHGKVHETAYEKFGNKPPLFDSRIFVLPESEVVNALLWRQQDASRNSIQMLARALYSHSECNNKNSSQLQDMCVAKGRNWNDEPTSFKRGFCIRKEPDANGRMKWKTDFDIPVFSQDREYISNLFPKKG